MVDLMFLAILYVLRSARLLCILASQKHLSTTKFSCGTSPEYRHRDTGTLHWLVFVSRLLIQIPTRTNGAAGILDCRFLVTLTLECRVKRGVRLGIFKSIWSADMCFTFYRVERFLTELIRFCVIFGVYSRICFYCSQQN